MELSIAEPGWEEHTPVEGVTCEIKRLSNTEYMRLQSDLLALTPIIEGDEVLKEGAASDIYSDFGRACFTDYVRKFEGLTVNGKAIKNPGELLNPKLGASAEITQIYTSIILRFFEINNLNEEETKN